MAEGPLDIAISKNLVGKRLESWKEIAAYLNRDVSTVQRWEKREGMPVHRHLHDQRGSAYAVPEELDAWRRTRGLKADQSQKSDAMPPNSETIDPAETASRFRFWIPLALTASIVVLAAVFIVFRHRPVNQPPATIRSLAVLPLRNLSGDPSQDYLADGFTEALIDRLVGIHDLRVISHTSVMRFKNPQVSVPEIAKILGVDAVVEGSVIRDGTRIRVTAQLIRGASDEHFWSETYDRELSDALTLESEVAQAITEKIEVTVTGQEHQRLIAARPVAPEVYES
ncbi:MAG: hypothetical protein ABSE36_17985, partial [Terracidiphilus sp.]